MSHWIETPGVRHQLWSPLFSERDLNRAHHLDVDWVHLTSDARVALVQDNGRRDTKSGTYPCAQFRLYHRSPNGTITELTNVVIGQVNGFVAGAEGELQTAEASAQAACVRVVRELLGGVFVPELMRE